MMSAGEFTYLNRRSAMLQNMFCLRIKRIENLEEFIEENQENIRSEMKTIGQLQLRRIGHYH